MTPPIFSLNINHIAGVSAYLDSEHVRFKFRSPLPLDSWHMLLNALDEFIQNGLHDVQFDLTEIDYPGSTDIGMWVTCNTRVNLASGTLKFIAQKSSPLHKLLIVTSLIDILDITLVA